MHAAPPVRISLAADPGWHAFIASCTGAAAASLAAWIAAQWLQTFAAVAVIALASTAIAGGMAWGALPRGDAGRGILAWDGAVWQWAPAGGQPGTSAPAAGDLRVMLDLGSWILLRFASRAAARQVVWLPVSRRLAGASWPLWRTALYSPRSSPDPATVADPP